MSEFGQKLESSDVETKQERIPIPTFGQRLRGWTVNLGRDFRGQSLRLATYIVSSTIVYTSLHEAGVDENIAVYTGIGVPLAEMIIGEVYLWKRLANRYKSLSWFRNSLSDSNFLENK